MTFPAAYPWAIVFPAHPTNFYSRADHGGIEARPKAMVLHTPEEDADNYPGTPNWFATYHPDPDVRGSTYYFVSYQLDERRPGFTRVYQCVDARDGAIANGLNGKPLPSWAAPSSLNWQTNNIEIEGRAATIHQTLNVGVQGKAQWRSLLDLCLWSARTYGYPLDREHHMGHYQLSIDRSDPGALFPWDALINDLNGGDDAMIPFNARSAWYEDPAHQKFGPGKKSVNATLDFHVPSEAVAVEADILLADDSGDLVIMCGLESDAPVLQAFHVMAKAGYMHGRVQLSAPDTHGDRWFHMENLGFVQAHLITVGVVGYYVA